MASQSLHARTVKKLPGGEYIIEVSLLPTSMQLGNLPQSGLWNITLPATTKNAERLLDPRFVDEPSAVWISSHGDEWDKELVRQYLVKILEK